MAKPYGSEAFPAKTVDEFDQQTPRQYDLYQKIVLMDERPQSWNKLKRLNHWKWQAEVNRVKDLVLHALGGRADTLTVKVDIYITAYFDKRPYDSDNVPAKLYIDGLKAVGLMTDDTIQYLGWAATKSEVDRDNPRVEIEIQGV